MSGSESDDLGLSSGAGSEGEDPKSSPSTAAAGPTGAAAGPALAAAAAGGLAPGLVGADDTDLLEYAKSLGVDLGEAACADLQWVVKEAFAAPLPPSWSEYTDEEGRVYFFSQVTQESSWCHPMDAVFKEVLDLVKGLRATTAEEDRAVRAQAVQAHLEEVHARAVAQLQGWSGPYVSQAGHYFYNATHDVSSWDNPVDEWQTELALRQRVLHRCLLQSQSEVLSPSGAQSGRLRPLPSGPEPLLELPRLPLGLNAPSQGPGQAGPKTPSSARSFVTARSGRSVCSARSGRSPTPSARAISGPIGQSARELEEPLSASRQPMQSREQRSEEFLRRLPPAMQALAAAATGPAAGASAAAAPHAQHPPPSEEDHLEFTFGRTEALMLPQFGSGLGGAPRS